MNGTPRSSPSSNTVTMFGCWSLAAALASISNRFRLSSSRIPSTVSVLIATSRSRISSRPRYTTPIPPRPIRPVTPYLPMRLRGRSTALPAGITDPSLQELDEDDGDVVLAAAGVRLGDQGPGRLLDVGAGGGQDGGDVVVGDHGGEAVRTGDQDVPGLRLVDLHVDVQVGPAAQRARHHVAQGVGPRLVEGQHAALELLVDPGMVAGELAEGGVAEQVDPAVPHVGQVGGVAVHQDRGHRGGHALVLALLLHRLDDLAVRVADRGLQAVAVVGDALVEAERPGDLLVAAGQAYELVDRLDGDLGGDLAGRVPAHPVGDHEQVLVGVDEEAVLVALALPPHVRERLVGDLHDRYVNYRSLRACGAGGPRRPPGGRRRRRRFPPPAAARRRRAEPDRAPFRRACGPGSPSPWRAGSVPARRSRQRSGVPGGSPPRTP